MARKFSPHTEPWERQPREKEEGYRDFLSYRDMGTMRSVAKVANLNGKKRRSLAVLATRNAWTERCRAWDNHLDRETQAAMLAAGRAAAVKHASLAGSSMAVLTPVILALDKRNQAGTLAKDLDGMSARELLRLAQLNAPALKALVEVERLSHGMTNNNLGISGPDGGPVKMISTADLLLQVFSAPDGIVDAGEKDGLEKQVQPPSRPDAEE